MKVSIDSILSTAININNRKSSNENSVKGGKDEEKFDIIEIRSRLASRLGTITDELKDLQSSLTRNQIIQDGLIQLEDDFNNNKGRTNSILENVKFENETVLKKYMDGDIDIDKISLAKDSIKTSLDKDMKDLKVIQVELENIIASNISDNKITDMISNIEHSISNIDLYTIAKISDLKPETVMGLL